MYSSKDTCICFDFAKLIYLFKYGFTKKIYSLPLNRLLRIASKFLIFLCELRLVTLFSAVFNKRIFLVTQLPLLSLVFILLCFNFSSLLRCNMQCYIKEKKTWTYLLSLILEFRDINIYLSMV